MNPLGVILTPFRFLAGNAKLLIEVVQLLLFVVPAVESLLGAATGEDKKNAAVSLARRMLEEVAWSPELEAAIVQVVAAIVSLANALHIFEHKTG